MTRTRGSALLWLIFTVLLFTLISCSLLKIALGDLRVSGHLVNAERAQYAAEAGIEYAAAILPWQCRSLAAGWQYQQTEPPEFAVTAEAESSSLLRIHAQGRAGGMVQDVEVLASLRPLGKQALITQQLLAQDLTVTGHVAADEVVFRETPTYIAGDLRTAWLEEQDGGTYHCSGYLWGDIRPYALEVDFIGLAQEAALWGWTEPDCAGEVYQVDGSQVGPLFAPGKTAIALQLPWEGLIVALGEVTLQTWVPGSKVMLVAAGEVELAGVDEVWEGSLFIYSGEKIYCDPGGQLQLAGCLVSPLLELTGLKITYDDQTVLNQLELVPAELLQVAPTFDLQWLELAPRR
ncbi:MAG TPA: pilus assembly PilX N-terminal domain-containing protein [Oscillospiraceae bacterium]|nr:pilus assembly PilX N-terminal domain-containing protein [Oscillospiraceae bacterium]